MQPVVLTDAEYGHDVRVVQPRGGAGLQLKALADELGFSKAGAAKDLERHMPTERLLHRFVDDAHAAAADLANDCEVADLRRCCSGRPLLHRSN